MIRRIREPPSPHLALKTEPAVEVPVKPQAMFHGTTILSVRRDGRMIIAGAGQVTLDKTVLKSTAKKVRRLGDVSVIAGFAGGTAAAVSLFALFEVKLKADQKHIS